MYIEFEENQKYGNTLADVADTHEHFKDAGYILKENEIVVDIDNLPKETIAKLITVFNIKTQTVWTERGAHFYFKKPDSFTRGANRVCALGFPIELKHTKNTKAITIKRNGKLREIENEGVREDLPEIFSINKKFENLLGYDDGDGRNKMLFKHRTLLAGIKNWANILRFTNSFVFSTPLDENEFQTVIRDLVIRPDKDNEPLIAEYLMNEYKMIKYAQNVYFKHEGHYTSDNEIMKRMIFNVVGNQKTRYIDEIMKQIDYRCPMTNDSKPFDILLKNGILRNGQFIEIDYDDFTPFSIDITYDPEAEPVKEVDDYITHLTNGDSDYKELLFEILGHTLVVDPEFKRLLAKFFIFVGSGGNGKGTLLQIIKTILNPKNCTGLSIQNMSDERYFVTLRGKLANLGDDIQDEPIDNEQMKQLKNISTCDYIESRELYKQSESIQLTTSLLFTSNHVLKSFEKGKSYRRRVLWLPMYTEIDDDNKDPLFITKLTTEKALEYWIKMIIEGYFRLYKNHKFTECKIVNDYNISYHKDNNTALIYLDGLTPEDIHHKRSPEIMEDYTIWAEENGLSVASARMMREAIRERFKMGIGIKQFGNERRRVYMMPDETNQELL